MDITIYSKDGCPACDQLKHMLRNRRLSYSEHKVGSELSKEEVERRLGKQIFSVPQVVIDGNHLGGFTETREHFQKLDADDVAS